MSAKTLALFSFHTNATHPQTIPPIDVKKSPYPDINTPPAQNTVIKIKPCYVFFLPQGV